MIDDLNPEVKVIEGEFVSVLVCINSCRNERVPRGIVPHAQMANGTIYIILINDISRLHYFRFLLSLAKSGIIPQQDHFISIIEAKAVRIEPLDGTSCWNIDGEVETDQIFEAMSVKRLIKVFSRDDSV